MATDVILATRGLTKHFGDFHALRGVDFTLRGGDLYGLVGQNGAGKTTLLRILAGLLHPGEGTIDVDGARVARIGARERAHLGALIDSPAFFGRLTGLENLLLLSRLARPFSRAEAEAALERVGLGAASRRTASEYSLGMRQRLALALATATRPRVLLLDEPTNGLDPGGVRDLREHLRSLHRDHGMTIVISSHMLIEVERLATVIGVMREGRIVVEEATATLFRRADTLAIEATPPDLAAAVVARFGTVEHEGSRIVLRGCSTPTAKVTDALVAAGVSVSAIGPDRAVLEDLILGSGVAT